MRVKFNVHVDLGPSDTKESVQNALRNALTGASQHNPVVSLPWDAEEGCAHRMCPGLWKRG